jgi:hypothetical protein
METEKDSSLVVTESDKSLSKENNKKRPLRSINKAKQEQEVVGEADTSTDPEPETSSVVNENKEPVNMDSEEQMNKEKLGDETSPGKKRRSRDIIAAYLTSAGVERANEQSPGSGTASEIDTKSILDKLDVDIDDANNELNSIIETLRSKKKRPQLGELKFHGWAPESVKEVKTGFSMISSSLGTNVDRFGASFGMLVSDLMSSNETDGESLLEVVFSPEIMKDLKKLEDNSACNTNPPHQKKHVNFVDDLRAGSNSPTDSSGSSKENDPEFMNTSIDVISSSVRTMKKKNTRKVSAQKMSL